MLGVRECWRADAAKVLRHLLIVQELRPFDTHQLDADAQDAIVFEVGRSERAGAREAHPSTIGLRLLEDAMPQLGREIGQHLEVGAHDTVRLGVPGSFDIAMLIRLLQEHCHLRSDGRGNGFLVGQRLFFGDTEVLISPPEIDERLNEGLDRLLEDPVECITKVWVKPALNIESGDEQITYTSL